MNKTDYYRAWLLDVMTMKLTSGNKTLNILWTAVKSSINDIFKINHNHIKL